MKLLLSSSSLVHSAGLVAALYTLLLPRSGPWKICHIITAGLAGRPAADLSWATEPWVTDEEQQLQAHGFLCQSLDITGWLGPALAEHLAGFDVLYIQGGNTFHLLDQMRRSAAERIIQDLVAEHGTVYCGVSAGSIVAGCATPTVGRVVHKAALMGDIPPAKANMIRAAVRAGIRPERVAKDFGVAVAMVRKLAAT